jgi:hypothetical protein
MYLAKHISLALSYRLIITIALCCSKAEGDV